MFGSRLWACILRATRRRMKRQHFYESAGVTQMPQVRQSGNIWAKKLGQPKLPFLTYCNVLQYGCVPYRQIQGRLATAVDGLFQLRAGNELRNFFGRNF